MLILVVLFLVYRKLYAIEILVLDKNRKTQFIEWPAYDLFATAFYQSYIFGAILLVFAFQIFLLVTMLKLSQLVMVRLSSTLFPVIIKSGYNARFHWLKQRALS